MNDGWSFIWFYVVAKYKVKYFSLWKNLRCQKFDFRACVKQQPDDSRINMQSTISAHIKTAKESSSVEEQQS